MRIPFVLIDNDGHPMLNQGDNACIQLSKDGAEFVDASGTVAETGAGCYYIDLTPSECQCTYYVNIKITIDGGQMTVLQYTPDIEPGDIADAVWKNSRRTLTSLNIDRPTFDPTPQQYPRTSLKGTYPSLLPCHRK